MQCGSPTRKCHKVQMNRIPTKYLKTYALNPKKIEKQKKVHLERIFENKV
jgi:N-formylglutamate amidohydrolase